METKSTVPFLRISSSSGIVILQLLLDSVLSFPYSVALSPHRLWLLLRQLTQKELGEKVGFSSKTADSRIRKYEKNIMAPKTEIMTVYTSILTNECSTQVSYTLRLSTLTCLILIITNIQQYELNKDTINDWHTEMFELQYKKDLASTISIR